MGSARQELDNPLPHPAVIHAYLFDQWPGECFEDEEFRLLPLLHPSVSELRRGYGVPVQPVEVAEGATGVGVASAGIGRRERPATALPFCPSNHAPQVCPEVEYRP